MGVEIPSVPPHSLTEPSRAPRPSSSHCCVQSGAMGCMAAAVMPSKAPEHFLDCTTARFWHRIPGCGLLPSDPASPWALWQPLSGLVQPAGSPWFVPPLPGPKHLLGFGSMPSAAPGQHQQWHAQCVSEAAWLPSGPAQFPGCAAVTRPRTELWAAQPLVTHLRCFTF